MQQADPPRGGKPSPLLPTELFLQKMIIFYNQVFFLYHLCFTTRYGASVASPSQRPAIWPDLSRYHRASVPPGNLQPLPSCPLMLKVFIESNPRLYLYFYSLPSPLGWFSAVNAISYAASQYRVDWEQPIHIRGFSGHNTPISNLYLQKQTFIANCLMVFDERYGA